MCGYFYIVFIDFMLEGKSLTQFKNLFKLTNFRKDDKVISNYFLSCGIKMVKISTNNGKIKMHPQLGNSMH